MKNAMKRIMSILLVALLLVSALPLGASAMTILDEGQKLGGNDAVVETPAAPVAPAAEEKQEVKTEGTLQSSKPIQYSSLGGNAVRKFEYRILLNNKDRAVSDLGTGIADAMQTLGGEIILDDSETHLTAQDILRKYYKYNDRTVFDHITAGGVTQAADFKITEGNKVEIYLNYIPLINVTIHYANNTMEVAGITVFSKGDISLTDLLKAAAKDPKFADLEISYKGYTAEINESPATTNMVKPGQKVDFYLSDTIISGGTGVNGEGGSIGGGSSGSVGGSGSIAGSTGSTGSGSNNGTVSGSGSVSGSNSDKLATHDVYLRVYLNTTLGSPYVTYKITNTAALDGLVDLSEAKNIVYGDFNAKTSAGISFDGLYLSEGAYIANYISDQGRYQSFDVSGRDYTVYLSLFINNATPKTTSTSTADTSNPKTGDAIFAPIAVLGVSATALAAVMFFYNKKRMAQ